MSSVTLGPVALPLAPLLVLLAVWASSWLAARLARQGVAGGAAAGADTDAQGAPARGAAAGDAVLHASLLGLLAARLSYLAAHGAAYAQAPLAAFDIRDGGWHAGSGIAAGLAWLLWQARRRPALRRPLAVAAGAGLLAWAGATTLLAPPAGPLPLALRFEPLDGGSALTLAQAAGGRPAVVNLWASWCGPCRQEMPVLAAAQQRQQTVAILFVNQGEGAAAVRAYLEGAGLPLRTVLLDPAAALGPTVGSRGLPTSLFIDAQGRLQDLHFGVLNAPSLQARIDRLVKATGSGPASAP
jgi:thiol-disulfide isomerase/thioredoxin